MIYGYVRVSTIKQLDGNGIEAQKKEILKVYAFANIVEECSSGAKFREKFTNLLNTLKNGDTLVVAKLDRFCRTTKEGLEYVDFLQNKGVRVHILNMGIIDDTPVGRMLITNLLAFAEFERSLIKERMEAGKNVARTKEGYKEGRPFKFTPSKIAMVLDSLLINGGCLSYSKAAELYGVSKMTLIRYQKRKKLT